MKLKIEDTFKRSAYSKFVVHRVTNFFILTRKTGKENVGNEIMN